MALYNIMSFFFALSHPRIAYNIISFVGSLVGASVCPGLFSLHLLGIIWRSQNLKNVLRAVTMNGRKLAVTVLLGLVLVWIYATLGFTLLRSEYISEEIDIETNSEELNHYCESMADCFIFTLWRGLIDGAPLAKDVETTAKGERMEDHMGRIMVDITFFAFFTTVLLNVIFGIIIDTFADMRGSNDSKQEDMQNVCFICGIDRATLDREGNGFEEHVDSEHNMWMYLFMFIHLKAKDKTELSGLESILWQYIKDGKNQQLKIFPVQRALCLMTKDLEPDLDDPEVKLLGAQVAQLEVKVDQLADTMHGVSSKLDQLLTVQPAAAHL